MSDLLEGFIYLLNSDGDLYNDVDVRQYINQEVQFHRLTNSGLAYVETVDGNMISVPKRNLTPITDRFLD